ncbi:unnamed protein product [Sphagnum balticum]
MLAAFDTSKVGGETALSICATTNSTFSSIFSKVELIGGNEEKFHSMVGLTRAAVGAYHARNKDVPR